MDASAGFVVWILVQTADNRRAALPGLPDQNPPAVHATQAACNRSIAEYELREHKLHGMQVFTTQGPDGPRVDGIIRGRWCAPPGNPYWWKPTAGYTWSSFAPLA